MSKSTGSRASWRLALVLSALIVTPAIAGTWGGDTPSPGGALAAKAIGQECRVLDAPQIAELDAYLAKAASEWKANPDHDLSWFDDFVRRLSADYTAKYRHPQACDADAAEEARDMLERVRRTMAAGTPIFDPRPERSPPSGAQALI